MDKGRAKATRTDLICPGFQTVGEMYSLRCTKPKGHAGACFAPYAT